MSRSLPAFPAHKPDVSCHHPDVVEKTYTIKAITPLFGGGVETGVNDPVTLFRPSSIRGHLRFWWRATRGARYTNVEALLQREGEIWGTTKNPSPVGLQVKVTKKDMPKPCARYEKKKKVDGTTRFSLEWESPFDTLNSFPYALFPFQGTAPDSGEPKNPAKFVGSAKFDLTVLIPTTGRMTEQHAEYNRQRKKIRLPEMLDQDDDIQSDVEAAVWAWVNFGGIGARTRRGCGALFSKDFAPSSVDSLG
ncbi:MAG: type III-B CRISPR module RAMP protein Cmr1, partial [Gammaproteobacteria bacterium]